MRMGPRRNYHLRSSIRGAEVFLCLKIKGGIFMTPINVLQLDGEQIKLAVQKDGRLTESTLQLLRTDGLQFESANQRLFSICRNFPLAILYVRDDDIPEYVQMAWPISASWDRISFRKPNDQLRNCCRSIMGIVRSWSLCL